MKLYSILVLRKDAEKATVIADQFDLSSFGYFQRSSVQEFMVFTATTVAERTEAGKRQSIESENNVLHIYSHPRGIATILISDKEYPSRVAFSLLNKVADEFIVKFPTEKWNTPKLEYPELAEYLRKYQDPKQADTIMKVQNELDETTAILVR
ncbi:palmitoyltransferase [Apophysomyces ossiformis]|uniref:Palmitoyltransferase n=1 Tax=Apophysomyces ossiformis TaxID=679940 RepID=A0A8H7BYB7_9FUNG|nr:palmitoyltransferase [Apophysomyces ossiformis]